MTMRQAYVSVFYRTLTTCNVWTACMMLPESMDASRPLIMARFKRERRAAQRVDQVAIKYA